MHFPLILPIVFILANVVLAQNGSTIEEDKTTTPVPQTHGGHSAKGVTVGMGQLVGGGKANWS